MQMPKKRLLLKLSGEILLGDHAFGVDGKALQRIAKTIQEILNSGYQLAIVIGGGNIFRGLELKEVGVARTPADQMGMLATLMNGIALEQALQGVGISAHLMSALDCPKVAESYNWNKAQKYLDAGEPVIFTCGTGSPYFTTDTAASLRASEMQVDLLLKATKVDGVYDKDPHKYADAKRYPKISYSQYLSEKLCILDPTAVALCMSNKIPIFVFPMDLLGKVTMGRLLADPEQYGSIIS